MKNITRKIMIGALTGMLAACAGGIAACSGSEPTLNNDDYTFTNPDTPTARRAGRGSNSPSARATGSGRRK